MADWQDENKLDGDPMEGELCNPSSSPSGRKFFAFQVKGQLSSDWSDWLEGLEVKLLENGEMMLCGVIEDQAALIGVLNKIHYLNLTLLSVKEVNQKEKF